MSETTTDEKPGACTNCARAKAKCIRPNGTGGCQRCMKGKFKCLASSVPRKRRGKATHAKVLEQKLDSVMALLTRDGGKEPGRGRLTEHVPCSIEVPATATKQTSSPDHSQTQTSSQTHSTNCSLRSICITPGFEVSFSDAEEILQQYRNTMLPEFPFVPIPPGSFGDIAKEKPFLTKVILYVCRPPPGSLVEFENWFRQHVSHEVVVLMNKSLELVQAILVFLAWNDIFFYAAAKDTALLQLAIGLIEDLGLTKPHRAENLAFESIVEDAAHQRNDLNLPPKQTRADHRALMGIFYIITTLGSLLGKPCRLDYTSHFDDCCRQILHDQEYPTDALLVNLVRICKISTRADTAFRQAISSSPGCPLSGIYAMAVASIKKDLATFMEQLPSNMKWNHLLQTHCAAIRIRLFEPFKPEDRDETPQATHLRSQKLMDCLKSTQDLFDEFCKIPADSYEPLTFIPILHVALAIIKAGRLLSFEDPAWDVSTTRSIFDFPGTLNQLSKSFEDASRLGGPRSTIILHGRPIFSEYAEAYRGIERLFSATVKNSAVPYSTYFPETGHESGEDFCSGFWNPLAELTNGLFPEGFGAFP